MITKIRTNGKMLMNMSGEAPTPWAYAGVTNIKILLEGEKPPRGGPAKFGRNIVGKVANATAPPGESAAFPAGWRVLEHDRRMPGAVRGKDHAPAKGWKRFLSRRERADFRRCRSRTPDQKDKT
ncbi:hypothetical protein [Mesorhizobium sp. M4A.F.Ca.ET.090.04.2.1]|uniref:hypothetical protein n=1 Tax=Mesorhizobium sp. M4A.F.Ca.ET.090.04.2.1 TaxID=2496663 RepID=UPI001AECD923|nr:hypothetical protein [Mesorhizobium sp. M4A.F.Ca.ET.090.04.2.1]